MLEDSKGSVKEKETARSVDATRLPTVERSPREDGIEDVLEAVVQGETLWIELLTSLIKDSTAPFVLL
jgi:hypothetical protein